MATKATMQITTKATIATTIQTAITTQFVIVSVAQRPPRDVGEGRLCHARARERSRECP